MLWFVLEEGLAILNSKYTNGLSDLTHIIKPVEAPFRKYLKNLGVLEFGVIHDLTASRIRLVLEIFKKHCVAQGTRAVVLYLGGHGAAKHCPIFIGIDGKNNTFSKLLKLRLVKVTF